MYTENYDHLHLFHCYQTSVNTTLVFSFSFQYFPNKLKISRMAFLVNLLQSYLLYCGLSVALGTNSTQWGLSEEHGSTVDLTVFVGVNMCLSFFQKYLAILQFVSLNIIPNDVSTLSIYILFS